MMRSNLEMCFIQRRIGSDANIARMNSCRWGKAAAPHHNDCIVLLGDAVAKNRLRTRCVGHQTGNGTASMKQRTK